MNPFQVILQLAIVRVGSALLNAGPSLENVVFDPLYYGLTALIIVAALSAAVVSLRATHRSSRQEERSRAAGMGLAALGISVVFVGATVFLALLRAGLLEGFLYQQMQFLVVYAGSAAILYGVDRSVVPLDSLGPQSKRTDGGRRLRAALWVVFAASVLVAMAYLFNPSTYAVTVTGGTEHVAQQVTFWFPPFVTMAAGAVGLAVLAVRRKDAVTRKYAVWFSLFFVLELIGVLRESTVIPSSGESLTDLLLAFVPFTAGGLCLLAGALGLRPLLALGDRSVTGPVVS